MSRSLLTLFASALLLAGCDSGADQGVQPQGELPDDKRGFVDSKVGEIDRVSAGSAMPELSFQDAAGNSLDLASFEGTPVLINLWATWCAPCIVEMPLLDNLAGEMGEDLRVLTISQDVRGADVVTPFFEEKGFANLEPWLDPANTLSGALETGGVMPLTVLYDAQGREVFRVSGDYEWDSEEAIAAISEGLAE